MGKNARFEISMGGNILLKYFNVLYCKAMGLMC